MSFSSVFFLFSTENQVRKYFDTFAHVQQSHTHHLIYRTDKYEIRSTAINEEKKSLLLITFDKIVSKHSIFFFFQFLVFVISFVKFKPYLINDASPANSETLLPIVFISATVANAVLVVRVDTLLPLPSLRCFGERTTVGAVVLFTLAAEPADIVVGSVVSCLSFVHDSVALAADAVADAGLVNVVSTVSLSSFGVSVAVDTGFGCVVVTHDAIDVDVDADVDVEFAIFITHTLLVASVE